MLLSRVLGQFSLQELYIVYVTLSFNVPPLMCVKAGTASERNCSCTCFDGSLQHVCGHIDKFTGFPCIKWSRPNKVSCLPLLLQVVQLFDSWAHHLSPSQFSEFSWPYVEQLIGRVKAARPSVPLIFHANGGSGKLHIFAQRSHQDVVLGLDWATEMSEARSLFGTKTVIQVSGWYKSFWWPHLSFMMVRP